MSNWFRSYGFARVYDELLIGAYPLDSDDVEMLAFNGVRRVLNLVEDGEYRRGERDAVQRALAANQIEESRLRLVDYGGLDTEAIEQAVQEVNGWLDDRRADVRALPGRVAALGRDRCRGGRAARGHRDRRGAGPRAVAQAVGRPAAAPARRSPPLVGYSAARNLSPGSSCTVWSRSESRSGTCTRRALVVTCSSSGSSRPAATAPWSSNRRAAGITRAS